MIFVQSAISAIVFFLLPVLIGGAFFILYSKKTELQIPVVTYFITGALYLYGWALFTKYIVLSIIPHWQFQAIFRLELIIFGVSAVLVNIGNEIERSVDFIKTHIKTILFLGLLAGITYFIWHLKTPYPLNWDLYEHQILANLIQKGTFSFVTSQMSDAFTFNGYSSIFQTLIASSQMLVPQINIMQFWDSITFIHLFLCLIASYYLALVVTDNEVIAGFSAVIGVLVFESNVAYTTLFFIPQNLTAVLSILIFIQIILGFKQNRSIPLPILILSCIFLFLNHYIIGTASILLLVCVYLYYKYNLRVHIFRLLSLGLFILIILGLIASFVSLGFVNNGEAQFYSFDILDKLKFMQNAYGFSLLMFLPLGIIALLKGHDIHKKLILIISICLLGLVLLRLPYSLKFYVLTRFFVHVLMAIGIWKILVAIKNSLLRDLAVIIFFLTLIVIFITNNAYFKSILFYKDSYIQVSKNEIDASGFLKEKYSNENALLISDPATQNIMEALSSVNTPGGAYMSPSMRKQLSLLHGLTNSIEVNQVLNTIHDNLEPIPNKRIFVLSGRYFSWQDSTEDEKQTYFYNIWDPTDLSFSDLKYIDLLQSDRNFNLVYLNPGVAVLEVR
ncbi:hypothetical protein HY029_03210 [Candidatus Gottesmanbacteria bacterium]|nr:hypothetical protein [Candidatus Gottesmanbacteria bacterium]